MQFRIADTFTDSLARLTGEEQRAAKTTAFDLQMNPASPGLSFHKLDKAKDKNFWSVRVNGDIRLIVHKTQNSLLLCDVDHHDPAYAWGERRKLETHPVTGAAQFVEIRERVHEVMVPVYRPQEVAPRPKSPLFAGRTDEEILSWGVPPEWLADVRLATEADVLLLAERLPGEAAEALLEVATGGRAPQPVPPSPPGGDPFAHPDALRRFRECLGLGLAAKEVARAAADAAPACGKSSPPPQPMYAHGKWTTFTCAAPLTPRRIVFPGERGDVCACLPAKGDPAWDPTALGLADDPELPQPYNRRDCIEASSCTVRLA